MDKEYIISELKRLLKEQAMLEGVIHEDSHWEESYKKKEWGFIVAITLTLCQQAYDQGRSALSDTSTPYQTCPKCNGQGTVSKPPYVAGDITSWTSSATSFLCDVCSGSKIIAQYQPLKAPTP